MATQSIHSYASSIGDPQNTNFPTDAEGRTYHLGIKTGDAANRVLMVGDAGRAKLIVDNCFDQGSLRFKHESDRGFVTYTGKVNGVEVTVMAVGMGTPMKDFAVRELRAKVAGVVSIIRLGSCGSPHPDVKISTVIGSYESIFIGTNYDAYADTEGKEKCFRLSKPRHPDPRLHQLMMENLKIESKDSFPVEERADATADSFYGSQGRIDDAFNDRNHQLIDQVMEAQPNTGTLQMETFHLFHLSSIAVNRSLRVAACAIVLAQRKEGAFLSLAEKHKIEIIAGRACLKTLVNYGT